MKRMIHTYDGGGNMGVGPATFMALSEQKYPQLIGEADATGGTSVGSILAAAEAMRIPFGKIREIFIDLCSDVWTPPSIAWRLDLRKPTYDGKGLEKALEGIFGDVRMCDLSIPLFVVAMDYSQGRIKVWDHTDGDYVKDVVRISCSAPTYLPPVDGKVDGGVVANNPAMCAITGACHKLGWGIEDMWMLSFGTNGDFWEDPHVDCNTNKLEWGKLLLETVTSTNEQVATFQSKALLRDRIMRIEPVLDRHYGLDDLDIITEYGDLWKGLWVLREEALGAWLKLYSETK